MSDTPELSQRWWIIGTRTQTQPKLNTNSQVLCSIPLGQKKTKVLTGTPLQTSGTRPDTRKHEMLIHCCFNTGHRLWRCPNIEPAMCQCLLFSWLMSQALSERCCKQFTSTNKKGSENIPTALAERLVLWAVSPRGFFYICMYIYTECL